MKSLWETSLNIRAFDVDENNRLKVSAIFDYFQDAAANHAENLKVGYTDLIPKGLFWVLSWAKFEFIDYPKFMDEINIQTWGKKQYKLYSMRDFLMLDKNDDVLCKATTAWLLLDAKSLRPKIMPQLFPDVVINEEKSSLDDLPEKFPEFPQTEKIYTKEIKYSDIDLNKHANNAKYLELLLDCYDETFHREHKIKALTVFFISESKYGDLIEVFKSSNSENEKVHFIEAKNRKTDKSVFNVMVKWQRII